MKETTRVKDLGFVVTPQLKWDHHISDLKRKAFYKYFLILQSFNSNCVWTLLKAYVSFVRPLVEYGTPVWNPHLDKKI